MLSDTDLNALHTRKKHTKGKSWCFGKKGWTKLNGFGEGGGVEGKFNFLSGSGDMNIPKGLC